MDMHNCPIAPSPSPSYQSMVCEGVPQVSNHQGMPDPHALPDSLLRVGQRPPANAIPTCLAGLITEGWSATAGKCYPLLPCPTYYRGVVSDCRQMLSPHALPWLIAEGWSVTAS